MDIGWHPPTEMQSLMGVTCDSKSSNSGFVDQTCLRGRTPGWHLARRLRYRDGRYRAARRHEADRSRRSASIRLFERHGRRPGDLMPRKGSSSRASLRIAFMTAPPHVKATWRSVPGRAKAAHFPTKIIWWRTLRRSGVRCAKIFATGRAPEPASHSMRSSHPKGSVPRG